MKPRWKEEEEEGGQERNGMIILSNDVLKLHVNLCKNLIYCRLIVYVRTTSCRGDNVH